MAATVVAATATAIGGMLYAGKGSKAEQDNASIFRDTSDGNNALKTQKPDQVVGSAGVREAMHGSIIGGSTPGSSTKGVKHEANDKS